MKPVISLMAALTFSVLFISCKKEYTPIVENAGMPLLVKIKSSSDSSSVEYSYNSVNLLEIERSKFYYIRYTYNNENQLKMAEVYYDDNLLSSSWEIVQTANNRTEWVTPENTPRSSYKTYEYDKNGKLISVSNYRKNGYLEYSELSYNIDGSVSRRSYFLESKLSAYYDFLYDEKGNLIKTSRYWVPVSGEDILSYTYEYEYDDKSNPFKVFRRLVLPGLNGIYTNENNIIKETYTIIGEYSSLTSRITEIHYEYNERGYPVKKGQSIEYEYDANN
jgi:hypothetical protein